MLLSELTLSMQSDASKERLLHRVVSPEEALEAHFQWRQDDEGVAVEQAAMWMSSPDSSMPVEDGGDAMEVDGADRTDGATSSGLLAHSPAARLSFI